MNFPDKRRVVECLRKLPSSNLEFEALEVGLSRLGSGSPKVWDSEGLKWHEKGQLWLPRRLVKEYYRPLPASPKGRSAWRSGTAERGIDLGDFGGEEGATVKGREGSECRILEEQRLQFLPGGLGEDVGEVALSKLGTANPSRPPQRGGGPAGQIVLRISLLHVVEFLVEHV